MKIQCNVCTLTDELQKVGIIPYPIFDNEDGTGDFTFPEGTDMELVQQIINAHNPEPLQPQPSDKERLEALEQAMLEIVMGGI